MNTVIRQLLGISAIVICLSPSVLQADGIVAVLKSPSQVIRNDAQTGSFKGSISVSEAIAVGCDGEVIAVLLANGTVNRYNALTGSFQGSISVGPKATSIQVSGGVIVVTADRQAKRYNAKTGSFMGSSSL